jgi:hypothetical protein
MVPFLLFLVSLFLLLLLLWRRIRERKIERRRVENVDGWEGNVDECMLVGLLILLFYILSHYFSYGWCCLAACTNRSNYLLRG